MHNVTKRTIKGMKFPSKRYMNSKVIIIVSISLGRFLSEIILKENRSVDIRLIISKKVINLKYES